MPQKEDVDTQVTLAELRQLIADVRRLVEVRYRAAQLVYENETLVRALLKAMPADSPRH